MAIPSSLQCELDKTREQDPGTRPWWAIRLGITLGLLSVPLSFLVRQYGGWGFLLIAGTLFAAGCLWWLAARLFSRERQRIEGKESSGRLGGWRGAIPMLTLLPALVLSMGPSSPSVSTLLPFTIFVVLVFLIEQAFAAKRASFDLLEAREQALQAKLAPHFIFNTLNTLHAQIESDPRGAQATTERLAALFRSVIEASDQPTVPLKEELAFVEAYLGIEQARFGERLKVRVDVPEDLESAPVLPLSLQVLVENAVKHGVAPLERGGEVRISAKREGPDLLVEVSDPGTGIGAEPGTGTALETLRSRLAKPGDLTLARVDGRTVASFRWRQP